MSAFDDTEARIQTCGRRSGVRSRDRRRVAAHVRPVTADNWLRLKGAYASAVDNRRFADRRSFRCRIFWQPTGSNAGTH